MDPNKDYTHTVFVEIATSQNCKPCHSWNQNIYEAYTSGNYDFEYVEMIVFDHNGKVLNEKALNWDKNYKIGKYPTSISDGDYKRIVGDYPGLIPNALNACGNRAIPDIMASIILSWLGNATIQVDITIGNNEETRYNGYIRACITDNNPPNEPSSPSPSIRAMDIDITAYLNWSCSDPDGGPLKYDVYFGSTSPPTQVVWNQSSKNYDPETMNYNTTYYWRIVAWDNYGASASGLIWNFTTAEIDNTPPKVKIIKQQRALYIKNKKILPRFFRLALIIGKITFEVNAIDEDSGIEKVEFYINGRLKGNDTTEPYTYEWRRDSLRFFHISYIKVRAYDNEGKTSC